MPNLWGPSRKGIPRPTRAVLTDDDLYSIVDTSFQPECSDLTAWIRQVARQLVREGRLRIDPSFEYESPTPYEGNLFGVRAHHQCDDCRSIEVCDDREFARRWKVVQVSAADYWAKGIKSPVRDLNRHIASLGVLHFNDRMYCPARIVDKDIHSLFDRARQRLSSRPDGIAMVDGLAVPIPVAPTPSPEYREPTSRQPRPSPSFKEFTALLSLQVSKIDPKPVHQHSWLFWKAHPDFNWNLSINPIICACGAFAIFEDGIGRID